MTSEAAGTRRPLEPIERPLPGTRDEWETAVQELIDQGQNFRAHDLAQAGAMRHPECQRLKQLRGLALLRAGALEPARAIIESICPTFDHGDELLLEAYESIRGAAPHLAELGRDGGPPAGALDALARVAESFWRVGESVSGLAEADEESLGLLARIEKELWLQTGDERALRKARDIYLKGFRLTGGYWTGISAASLTCVLGERDGARELARRVLGVCESARAEPRDDPAWNAATVGEAHLLLGGLDEARAAYREAAERFGGRVANVVSCRKQLVMLRDHGVSVPDAVLEVLQPPSVVAFAGHMIDAPDRPSPRFPAALEEAVRAAIEERLEALGATVGYCSAACGSDILFIEAMLDRGAEVNVILPFDQDDFVATSVRPAGARWVTRFRAALELADQVTFATQERHLGDQALYRFAATLFRGMARPRARALTTRARLLAVWDGVRSDLIGGTSDIVERWPDRETLHVIRLDELSPARATQAPPRHATPGAPGPAFRSHGRVIRSLLFADFKGYSKLREEDMPAFLDLLEEISKRLEAAVRTPPVSVNTWGDAIFAVHDEALPLAEYAVALLDCVRTLGAKERSGLPTEIELRAALHVGPVFETRDAITGRPNVYGAEVNRAARLEPVTLPGQIYASQQFAALLETEMSDGADECPFVCDYVGVLTLPKDFGTQSAYHLRRRPRREPG